MSRHAELLTLSEEYLRQCDKEALKNELCEIELEREAMLKTVNMTAIHEYKKKSEEYKERFGELEAATAVRDEQRAKYEELRRLRLQEFMEGTALLYHPSSCVRLSPLEASVHR